MATGGVVWGGMEASADPAPRRGGRRCLVATAGAAPPCRPPPKRLDTDQTRPCIAARPERPDTDQTRLYLASPPERPDTDQTRPCLAARPERPSTDQTRPCPSARPKRPAKETSPQTKTDEVITQ